MKIKNGKKLLNLLLIAAAVALIVTQFLVINGHDPRKELSGTQPGAYGRVSDGDTLLQSLPDSLFDPGNPRLVVLRMQYSECKDCRDSLFEGARRLAARIGKKNFCIIAGRYQENDFLMHKRLYSYDLGNFIAIPGKIAASDTGVDSYYFMVNKNFPGKIKFLFTPDPNNYGPTADYFDKLTFLFN